MAFRNAVSAVQWRRGGVVVVWVWCQLNAIQFRAAELKLQCASSGESGVE